MKDNGNKMQEKEMKGRILIIVCILILFNIKIKGAPEDSCEAIVNSPYEITIKALENGELNKSYSGTVIFMADKKEDVILPSKYTFNSFDEGEHIFEFIFLKPGLFTIYVYDITNGNTISEKEVLVKKPNPQWTFTSTVTPTVTYTNTPTIAPTEIECISIYVSEGGNHRIQVFDGNGNYIRKWGSYGTGPGEFRNPWGVFVSEEGEIYVVDMDNHRIQVFDKNGVYKREWGRYGSGEGEFNFPCDIAIGNNNRVYVTDTWNSRVQVFNKNGEYLYGWNGNESGEGNLSSPRGIAVDKDNYVYVCDYGNYRIIKYDEVGNYILQWGNPPELISPFGICLGTNGYLYVLYIADEGNDNIQVITNTGEKLFQWGEYGSGPGQLSDPYAIDSINNKVYIVETTNHRVQVFDMQGNYIMMFGTYGTGDGQLLYPRGLAVESCRYEEQPTPTNTDLLASNYSFNKKQIPEELNKKNVYCYPNPAQNKTTIRIPAKQKQKIKIYNIKGEEIWEKEIEESYERKEVNEIIWECKDKNGQDVSNGIYLIRINNGEETIVKKIAVVK